MLIRRRHEIIAVVEEEELLFRPLLAMPCYEVEDLWRRVHVDPDRTQMLHVIELASARPSEGERPWESTRVNMYVEV